MSIYVTGDIHGYPIRLSNEQLNERGVVLAKTDKLIICGDFGLPWYNDLQDLQCLEWLAQKPFEILFVDGNHENFDLLNAFPVEVRYGGKVHKLRGNIYHLMRGEVYEIEGKTFFTFGGASSYDKHTREEHVSWWAEEVYNKEELFVGVRNLICVGYEVDYVITHTAPRKFINQLDAHLQGADICLVAKLLGELSNKIKWKKWYFGHFHTDANINEAVTCVYDRVIKIED